MTPAYHGTDRLDFTRLRLRKASASQVDIAEARPFNIGLHFGTRVAALSRIDYLCENGRARTPYPPSAASCEAGAMWGAAPLGIDLAALQRRLDRLTARSLAADDNPRYEKDPSLYAAFNARMNVSIRRLFQALGYDRSSPSASPRQVGFVYTNELEDGSSAADSYCVFTSRQVAVVGDEMVKYGSRSRRAA